MGSHVHGAGPDILRRVRQIQSVTIVWMTAEAIASLAAAWRARSPALLAFGGDSAIELLSAVVVLWQFRANTPHERTAKRAAQITGALLFSLAVYVVLVSARSLLGYGEPKPSYLGIGVLLVAAIGMPWLAREKRKLSAATGSAALKADAAESTVCAYLSVITLVGLGINGVWHVAWADPVAAVAIVPFIMWEGWEAMQGKACGCC